MVNSPMPSIDASPLAVVGLAADLPSRAVLPAHRHRRGQLVYAARGVMTVTTSQGAWVVPSQRAVWVPPEVEHRIVMSGDVEMRTLYLRRDAARGLPGRCCVLSISPLLRELLLRVVELPRDGVRSDAEQRLTRVLLDELQALDVAALHLPSPEDPRARRVTDALLRSPDDERPLAEWARLAGASPRTLARLFRRETGMSFGAWRRQLRLLRALERLATGEPVTAVALSLGYNSPSAFVAMFRRNLGTTPSRYY